MASQSLNLGGSPAARGRSPTGRSPSPTNAGRATSQSVVLGSPRPAAAGRSHNTVHLPPSFERAAAGVEDAARSAYHSLQAGAQAAEQAVEARFAPTRPPISRASTQSSMQQPHKPVFQRSQTTVPGYPAAATPPSTTKSGKFFIEPSGTAMYTMAACGLMMGFACWIPFYLGVSMLFDKHYRLWIGWEHPFFVMMFSLFMPVAFVGCVYIILGRGHGSGVRTEETMVLVGGTFTSLLGVVLCLLALPMSTSSAGTIARLSFGCDLADPTSAKMVFYSQVLHNMRNAPECQTKGSVKDCAGWKSNKYTEYLQRLENDFDCTGLCTLPAPPTAPPAATVPVVAPHPAAGQVPVGTNVGATTGPQGLFLNQKSWTHSKTNRTKSSKNSKSSYGTEIQSFTDASSGRVPALKLFSQEKTDQRCYPLVADHLQVTASTAGELLFWQGVGLLFVSVIAGSVKVVDKTLFEK